jgi:hypothetical protein
MMRRYIDNIKNTLTKKRNLKFKITGKNLIYVTLTAIILLATIIVAISGFSTPSQIEKTETLVSYNLQGTFSNQPYGYQSLSSTVCLTCGETDLVYFPKIISAATGSYTYEFLSEEKVSNVKTNVQISAIVTQAGYWSKELVLLPSQAMTGTSVTFPLDTNGYLVLANNISDELGLGKVSSVNVTLTANVQTDATIGGAVVKDNFTQTCEITLSSTIMKWTRPLDLSRKGFQASKAYEQRGNFGYTLTLSSNQLFGAATLKSPSPPVRNLRKLTEATSYQSDKIDKMEVNFAYSLAAEEKVSGINNEVSASVVLSSADGEQAVFPLLTAKQFPGDLTVKLPIDVDLLYDIIRKMENTTANDFDATYTLLVRVNVHTVATTPGAIDEKISALLPIKINASGLVIEEATGNAKTGSVTETTLVSNSARSTILMIALSLLALTLVMGLWTGYQIWESRREPSIINDLWESTQQTAEKHKGIIVNVAELPEPAETEKVTQIGSLAELVKLADSLLKPILHQKDAERHVYCVIDGMARYVFMTMEPLSS